MTSFLKSHYYFVDEAGNPAIWGRRRRDLRIGGSDSQYFMMGLADIRGVRAESDSLNALRVELLADPALAGITSLQPARKKTALQFHAKDDHPRVRERVFDFICRPDLDLRFYAVVRDKRAVLESVERMRSIDASYRYGRNSLYDGLVRRLFSGRLHFVDSRYTVYFAQREKSDRQKALLDALHAAQRDYERYAGIMRPEPRIRFISGYPARYEGLQLVDYCTWSLQRLFEQRDNTYWKRIWDAGKVKCVVDMDATDRYEGGEIYTADNPLTGELWHT